MGDTQIQPEANGTLRKDCLATYTALVYAGSRLPAQYKALVYSKWLRSYRFGTDMMKLVDSDSYYGVYHKYIDRILNDPLCNVCLAVLSDDRDVVLGFSVSRGTVLDYVHVQKEQRKQGIGTFLIPQSIDTISHMTRTAVRIWSNKYSHWKFNPFI